MATPSYQILEIPEVSFEKLGKLLELCDSKQAQLRSFPADWGWLDFDCPDVRETGVGWHEELGDGGPFLMQVISAQYDPEDETFTVRIKFHFRFLAGKSVHETKAILLVSMHPLRAIYSILGVLPDEEKVESSW